MNITGEVDLFRPSQTDLVFHFILPQMCLLLLPHNLNTELMGVLVGHWVGSSWKYIILNYMLSLTRRKPSILVEFL